MRTKAEKLEKGKWYCDLDFDGNCDPTFLKFSHSDSNIDIFSDSKGWNIYKKDKDGFYGFVEGLPAFIPTPEDIEKYGLIDDETT